MAITVAAFNVGRGLSDPARAEGLVREIDELDADVVVISEAFESGKRGFPEAHDGFQRLGYSTVACTEYGDAVPHPSGEQYLLALGRLPMKPAPFRAYSRNVLMFGVEDPDDKAPIYGVGMHGDDRNEVTRTRMAMAVVHRPGANHDLPTLIAGDLNTMPPRSGQARVLTSFPVRTAARYAPHPRVRSLGTRVSDMARGDSFMVYQEAGFNDTDPAHAVTKIGLGGLLRVQLDHVLVNSGLEVVKHEVVPSQYSDHHAVVARVALASV